MGRDTSYYTISVDTFVSITCIFIDFFLWKLDTFEKKKKTKLVSNTSLNEVPIHNLLLSDR